MFVGVTHTSESSIISASEGRVAAERALWLGGKLLAGKYGFFRKARKVLFFRRSIDLEVMAAGKTGSDEALREKTVFRQKIAALAGQARRVYEP